MMTLILGLSVIFIAIPVAIAVFGALIINAYIAVLAGILLAVMYYLLSLTGIILDDVTVFRALATAVVYGTAAYFTYNVYLGVKDN